MYSVFGDESSDERCERVFAIGGLFGNDVEWEQVIAKWIEITHGEEFHATQRDTPEHQEQYISLIHVLADSKLLGFGAAMSVDGLAEIFPQAVEQYPYYYCFGRIILHFAKIARLCIPPAQVKFMFHQNLTVQKSAADLYHDLTTYPEWEGRTFVADEISYGTSKDPRIQAADLWAREVMKHADNTLGPVKRRMRQSLSVLRSTHRFGFDVYERSFFESMKENWNQWHRGTTAEQFSTWRKKHKLRDSGAARIRFLVYLNTIETQNMLVSHGDANEKDKAAQ